MEQEGERRLAAILSADVVGYSRLMSEDEAATVRTLTAYREQIGSLVRDHRGRVVDFTGDNFLAEFRTALDAVGCAIEIQRVLRARNAGLPPDRKMEFRLGAHMGDVRVEGERIYGDGVNIAARLEAMAEPGGICISATVHEQVRNKLEIAYTDLGDRSVKNIPDQVHVYSVRLDEASGASDPAARTGIPRWAWAVAAALVVAVGAWLAWPRLVDMRVDAALTPPEHPPLPDRPSIVVLPFANMSGDPEQEYFADGITEDLTTALSRTSSLFVISRNSAFTYRGQAVKVEDVGRELGVRYVLEGSVRRSGNDVRVIAQLIDATSGFHVWSDKYDRELSDIFAVQSEISESILGAVGANINDAELERIRRKPTESLTAYDAYARAYSLFNRFRKSSHYEARRLLERAIEIDPEYAEATSLLGSTYSAEFGLMWTLDTSMLDRAEQLARRAIDLDAGIPGPYIVLGTVNLNRGRDAQALGPIEQAIARAPNDPSPHAFRAVLYARSGEPERALRSLERVNRLNPRATSLSTFWAVRAGIYANTGRMDEAIALWERTRAENPDLVMARVNLAERYQASGRREEAREVVREIRAINPRLTAADVFRYGIDSRVADVEGFRAHLRAAGLP